MAQRVMEETEQGRLRGWLSRAQRAARRVSREQTQIVPFRGYGTGERVWLRGRVMRDRGVHPLKGEVSRWRTLYQMLLRFTARPVAGARLRVSLGGATREVETDARGLFEVTLRPQRALDPRRGWHAGEVRWAEAPEEEAAEAEVMVPPSRARAVVVSDMDDTIVHTHAMDRLQMVRIVALQSAGLRTPFCGVRAFYRALREGASGDEGNPVFYVSSSSWAIHDVLEDFLAAAGLPRGPLMLRPMRFTRSELFGGSRHDHKLDRIGEIADAYPSLPLILIGDTGQRDPWLYAQVAERYPGRVPLVYLRDVNTDTQRATQIRALARQLEGRGVEVRLVSDTAQAAAHAAERGWIAPQAVAEVEREVHAQAEEGVVSNCRR